MTSKRDRIRRLVKVQRQIEQIEAQKLQQMQLEAQRLRQQETAFLEHMSDHTSSGQQLTPILSKRLTSVMRERAVQQTSVSGQEASLLTQSVRLRGLEKVKDKREVVGQREEIKQDLANIVESATGRKLTRLP